MSHHEGTATDYQDFLTQLEQIATSESAETAVTVAAGGTGYVVGDILVDADGGTNTHISSYEVLTESAGVVTSVRVADGGAYTVAPTTPFATTGGGGTGCTLTPTFAANGWVTDRDTTPGGQKEIIMHADEPGGITTRIGFRTYNIGSAFNIEVAGMSGFVTLNDFDDQPGISPGRHENGIHEGAYAPLANASLDYWVSVTDRRIRAQIKVSSAVYSSFYAGLINTILTTTEFPYPLYIAASTSKHDLAWNTGDIIGGLTDPVATSALAGPGLLNTPNGWVPFRNSTGLTSGTRVPSNDSVILPAGQPNAITTLPLIDQVVGEGAYQNIDMYPQTGDPQSGTVLTGSVPQVGDNIRPMEFPDFMRSEVSPDRFGSPGRMDGVFKQHAEGFAAEATFLIGSVRYRIFPEGNRGSRAYAFVTVEET